MPHRPNPIPRFNGSNNAQNQSSSSIIDPTVLNARRERDLVAPRHRAGSLHTQSGHGRDVVSPSLAQPILVPTSNVPSTTNPSSGGGRSGGRALPPPRFQRKQRPPRVQQAIAAANAVSGSNPNGHSQPRGSRRGGGNTSTTPGTLTLGPANNWGAGTGSVVSLSMDAINAASARASVVHRQQQPPPSAQVPPQLPPLATTTANFEMGDIMEDDTSFVSDDLRGLDPVQLHNRLTFGMGRARNDSFNSDYAHGPIEPVTPPLHPHAPHYPTQSIPALQSGPPLPLPPPPTSRPIGVANNRARSRSHNNSAGYPVASQGPPQPHNPRNPHHGYNFESPSVMGTGIPPPTSFSQSPHNLPQPPHIDSEHAYRIRSRSLMAPVDSMSANLQKPPPFSALPSLPYSHHLNIPQHSSSSQLSLDSQLDSIINPLLASHPSFVSNASTSSLPVNSSNASYSTNLSNPSPTSPTTKRPLKSALKIRRSAPEFIDTGMTNMEMGADYHVPPLPNQSLGQFQSVLEHDLSSVQPQYSSASYDPSSNLPDPNFTLPDSLQAQYAYQLKLLQQEYASKAARAERLRQRRGDDPNSMGRARAPNHGGVSLEPVMTRFSGIMLGGRDEPENMTPPSSGGGSASGHRVSFHSEVGIIEGGLDYVAGDDEEYVEEEGDYDAYGVGEYEELDEAGTQGQEEEAGYASWDDGWPEQEEDVDEQEEDQATAEGEEEDEAFNYAFGDGFGSLDPPPPIVDPATRSDRSASLSGSQPDEDGGSVVGDRGHEDQQHHQSSSPLNSLVSPTRAIFHGHGVEDSPTVSTNSSSDVLGRNHDNEQGDHDATLVPQVEVIAPTPVLKAAELGDEFETGVFKALEKEEEAKPKEEMPDSKDVEVKEETRKSEDSIAQKNSSSSTEEGSSGSNESNATVQHQQGTVAPVVQAPDAIESGADTTGQVVIPLVESPTASVNPNMEPVPQPHLPPALQRLAPRLSRGGANPIQAANTMIVPNRPSQGAISVFQPLRQDGDPSAELPQPVQFPSFVPAFSQPAPASTHSSARATPTQENHRSQSGRRRSVQQPVGRSQFGNQPDMVHMSSMPPTSFPMQQRNPSLRSLSQIEDIDAPLPGPPSIPNAYAGLRARNSSFAMAEISSAASIESGSSHGGGTSGASHAHPFGRPHSSSFHYTSPGVHGSSPLVSPSVASVLPSSRASASTRSLPKMGGSVEGWEEDNSLFNVRSHESLKAASITSGRSVGSGGSGKGVGRALGGESIWTVREDEGGKWPSAPPSSSGHSMAAKNSTQWTLQSLINDSMSQSHSSDGRSLYDEPVLSEDALSTGYRDLSRHPYQSMPAGRFNQSVSSFQSGHSFGESPSAPAFNPNVPQRTIVQSQSTPAFLQYEGNDHEMLQTYSAEDLNRNRAMRVAQVKAQGASFVPPSSSSNSASKRFQNPPSRRPMPPVENTRRSRNEDPAFPIGSTGTMRRSRNHVIERPEPYSPGNLVSLPASGGVFPRLQEISVMGADGSRIGVGNNKGLKNLFKNRDSRVFK